MTVTTFVVHLLSRWHLGMADRAFFYEVRVFFSLPIYYQNHQYQWGRPKEQGRRNSFLEEITILQITEKGWDSQKKTGFTKQKL